MTRMYNEERSDNPTKQMVRRLIIEDLENLKYSENNYRNRILTLPSLNFELETKALELGYTVNTVEKDEDIYEQQIGIRRSLECSLTLTERRARLRLNNESLFNYLYRLPTKYDLVYADFCGAVSEEVRLSLVALFSRTKILYITINLAREHIIYCYLFTGDKIADYTDLFNREGFRVDKVIKYQNHKSPMCTFRLVKDTSIKIKPRKKRAVSIIKNELKKKTSTRTSRNTNKYYGSINPFTALQGISFSRKILNLGFDIKKKYDATYHPQINQFILKESPLETSRAITHQVKTGTTFMYLPKYITNMISEPMRIVTATKDNDNWILQLEPKEIAK